MDAAALGLLLDNFTSVDANLRRNAEESYNGLRQRNPNECALLLLTVMKTDVSGERRQQAALALRTAIRDGVRNQDDTLWSKLSASTQETLKLEILHLCASEQDGVVRRALEDLVSQLGHLLLDEGEWPQLPEAIMKMITHEDVQLQIFGLNVCAELQESMQSHLSAHMTDLVNLLKSKLDTANNDLRLAAVTLICQIVSNEDESTWKCFSEFLPAIIHILRDMSTSGDETNACSLLKCLSEVAEFMPEYFKPHMPVVSETVLGIAAEPKIDESIRQLAVELILTIVDNKPHMASKTPHLLERLIQVLMEFMLDTDANDEDWIHRDSTNEVDAVSQTFDIGECGMDRAARAVGGKVALPIIFAKVGQYLQQEDWQHNVAAIVAICQTVEYIPTEEVEEKLGPIVEILLNRVQNAHYRVRNAALRAIGQVALDHQPYVQLHYHEQILPALMRAFEDPVARVQSQAFAAFINFAEELEADDLIQYVPDVMAKIMTRLGPNFSCPSDAGTPAAVVVSHHRCIREQCVTSVAVISGVLAEQFIPYCGTIVPLMKDIVTHSVSSEMRQLRGRALECLSIIGYSVGVDRLKDDMHQIFQALVSLFNTPMAADDPVKEYIHEALRRLVKCFKGDCAQYIPNFLPTILNFMSGVSAQPLTLDEIEDGDYTFMSMQDGTCTGVQTSLVDEMELQLQLLSSIVESMEGAFGPWVLQSVNVVAPLLKIRYSNSVRRLALNCMGDLMGSARAAGADVATIQGWMLETMEEVFLSVSDSKEVAVCGVEHLTANIGGLAKCMTASGSGVLQASHVESICQKLFVLIEESTKRREDLERVKDSDDADHEDWEQCDEEIEREQLFRETLLRVLEALMQTHSELFIAHGVPLCLNYVNLVLSAADSAYRKPDCRALAVYICCDILENLKETGVELLRQQLRRIVQCISDENAKVRQGACFATCLAVSTSSVEKDLVAEAAQRLLRVLQAPDAQEQDNLDATDNAVSALQALLIHHSSSLPPSDLQTYVNALVANLPLKSDEEEGQKVHEKLCTHLLDESSPLWGGKERSNVSHIIKVLGAIYKTPFTNDETDQAIRNIISTIGLANIPALINTTQLKPSERRGLQKIERDINRPNSSTTPS